MIDEKLKIQNKLDVRYLLSTLGKKELVELSKDEKSFDYFIRGLSWNVNSGSVCYFYHYNDIIREMIKNNERRLEVDKDLMNYAYNVLYHLDSFGKESCGYRSEFSAQYESLFVADIGLNVLGISIDEFNKNASSNFKAITEGKIDDIKHEKNFIATVSYLSKYHPEYLRNCFMNPTIMREVYSPNKNDFEDKEDYRNYKKTCRKIIKHMDRYNKQRIKVMAKSNIPHGYDN